MWLGVMMCGAPRAHNAQVNTGRSSSSSLIHTEFPRTLSTRHYTAWWRSNCRKEIIVLSWYTRFMLNQSLHEGCNEPSIWCGRRDIFPRMASACQHQTADVTCHILTSWQPRDNITDTEIKWQVASSLEVIGGVMMSAGLAWPGVTGYDDTPCVLLSSLFTVHQGPVYAGHWAVIELYGRQYQNITGIMIVTPATGSSVFSVWRYHDHHDINNDMIRVLRVILTNCHSQRKQCVNITHCCSEVV